MKYHRVNQTTLPQSQSSSAYHFVVSLDRLNEAHNVWVLECLHDFHLALQQPQLLFTSALWDQDQDKERAE